MKLSYAQRCLLLVLVGPSYQPQCVKRPPRTYASTSTDLLPCQAQNAFGRPSTAVASACPSLPWGVEDAVWDDTIALSNASRIPCRRHERASLSGAMTAFVYSLQKSTAFLHQFRTLLAGGQALSKPVEGRRTCSVAVPCTGKPRPRRPRRNGRGSCFHVREPIKEVEGAVAITAPPPLRHHCTHL